MWAAFARAARRWQHRGRRYRKFSTGIRSPIELPPSGDKDRQTPDQAHAVLLAAAGGEPSDGAAIWSDDSAYRGAGTAGVVGLEVVGRDSVMKQAEREKADEGSAEERTVSSLGSPRGHTDRFRVPRGAVWSENSVGGVRRFWFILVVSRGTRMEVSAKSTEDVVIV